MQLALDKNTANDNAKINPQATLFDFYTDEELAVTAYEYSEPDKKYLITDDDCWEEIPDHLYINFS